jgi:hypothetical protein
MDSIYLPYLRDDKEISFALKRLKGNDRRAIVVLHADSSRRLYFNKVVVKAWSEGKTFCSEFPQNDGEPVVSLGDKPVQGILPRPNLPPDAHLNDQLNDTLEELLNLQKAKFGFLFEPEEPDDYAVILLITKHEDEKDRIAKAVKACTCDVNKQHCEDCPPAEDGGDCFYCEGKYDCY